MPDPKIVGLDWNDVALIVKKAGQSEKVQVEALRDHVNHVITEGEAKWWVRKVKNENGAALF